MRHDECMNQGLSNHVTQILPYAPDVVEIVVSCLTGFSDCHLVIKVVVKPYSQIHTDPLFMQFKIIKFDDIYKFQLLKFMFLHKNKVLPDLFKEMVSLRSEVHSYNTRNSNWFHSFSCRTNVSKFSIRSQGPLLFNQLNSDIKNAGSISLFKTKLKAFF